MNTQDFYTIASFSRICGEIGIGLDMAVEVLKYYYWRPNEILLKCKMLDEDSGEIMDYDVHTYSHNTYSEHDFYKIILVDIFAYLRGIGIIDGINWYDSYLYLKNNKNMNVNVPLLATLIETNKCISSNIEPFTSISALWDMEISFYLVEN